MKNLGFLADEWDDNFKILYTGRAVSDGDINELKRMHKKGVLSQCNSSGFNALYHFNGILEQKYQNQPKKKSELLKTYELILKYLLSKGLDINHKAVDDVTPLLFAVYKKNLDVVKLLIKNGASIDACDSKARNALHYLARCYDPPLEMLTYLVSCKINLYALDSKKRNILHVAIKHNGSTFLIEYLLKYEDLINAKDYLGNTPLFFAMQKAAETDEKAAIALLFQAGADVNASNINGQSAFLYAASQADLYTLRMFCKHADIAMQCTKGKNALMYVLESELEVVNLLDYLISEGVKLDATDKNNRNALHYAAQFGSSKLDDDRVKVIQRLIERGLFIDALDSQKNTALLVAASAGNIGRVEYLISKGASVNVVNLQGYTPLLYVAQWSIPQAWQNVKLLVDKGADITACNRDGWNALHIAASTEGGLSLVKYLLEELKFSLSTQTIRERKTAEELAANEPIKEYLTRRYKVEEAELIHSKTASKQVSRPHSLRNVPPNSQIAGVPISSRFALNNQVMKLLQELSIAKEQLEYGKELGKGGFGVVYKGSWHGEDVAIKQLKGEHLADESNFTQFIEEASMMFKLRNPRVVTFYGITDSYPCDVVMEFMPRGSLRDVLATTNFEQMSWKARLTYAQDIASGLSYLHGLSTPIIHCDLKSLNVLVDENYRAKLTDFGLSVLKKADSTTLAAVSSAREGCGTPQWMAPELFNGQANTDKSDMYAFGMILWEIATHRIPYAHLQLPLMSLMFQIMQGLREEFDSNVPQAYQSLAKRSWSAEVSDRPTAKEAVAILKDISFSQAEIYTVVSNPLIHQNKDGAYQINTVVGTNNASASSAQHNAYQANTVNTILNSATEGAGYQADTLSNQQQMGQNVDASYQVSTQVIGNSSTNSLQESNCYLLNTMMASTSPQLSEAQQCEDYQLKTVQKPIAKNLPLEKPSNAMSLAMPHTTTMKLEASSNNNCRSALTVAPPAHQPQESNITQPQETIDNLPVAINKSTACQQPTTRGDMCHLVGFNTAPIPRRTSEPQAGSTPPALPRRVYTVKSASTTSSSTSAPQAGSIPPVLPHRVHAEKSASTPSSMSILATQFSQQQVSSSPPLPKRSNTMTLSNRSSPPVPRVEPIRQSADSSATRSSPLQIRKALLRPPGVGNKGNG